MNESRVDDKSEDKKKIEDEERERDNMYNKHDDDDRTRDAADERTNKPAFLEIKEGREVQPKKIPIGGIKMPGFFTRSKSKERCREDDLEDGEQVSVNETANPQENNGQANDKGPTEKESKTSILTNRPTLLQLMGLRMRSVIPKRLRHGRKRGNLKEPQAGLASMETLGDMDKTDDGMESIKLEPDKDADVEMQKPVDDEPLLEKLQRHKIVALAIFIFSILLIVIVWIVASGPRYSPVAAPIEEGRFVKAVTSCGLVQGILEDGAIAFRGIPYALPPVDDRRWTHAAPLDNLSYCWNGTFLAHNSSSTCWQIKSNGSTEGSEDCLTLDVVTPYVRYDTPIPVVVLIGSESYTGDTPSKMRPSARYARSRDVIFVRPNFRVGVLGFLAVEPLTRASYPRTSGNYGLTDILQALRWVQLNIEHFGGDKHSVTLFGHRVGATLVTALAASKQSKGLFSKIWATSGSTVLPRGPLDEAEKSNRLYLMNVQCEDAVCLRNRSAEELLDAVPDTWRYAAPNLPDASEETERRHEWLVLDNVVLTDDPIECLTGDKVDVKIVVGTTAHADASDKLFLKNTEWTPELVREHYEQSYLAKLVDADETFKRYNATYKGLVKMISDVRTVCPLVSVARRFRNATVYVATMTRDEQDIADVDTDVAAILGRYEARTPEQRRYVAAMQQLFYHFVCHGTIPQTENARDEILIVDQDTLPADDYPNCDFWTESGVVPKYANVN